MHFETCVNVMAHVVNVLHATLSNVGAYRADAKMLVMFTTANNWRDETKIVVEVVGGVGPCFVECRVPSIEERSCIICVPFLSSIPSRTISRPPPCGP
jgi:hypothetical protein